MEVKIKETLKSEIYSLIKSSKREIVLLLDGTKEKGVIEIHGVVPVKNIARSSSDFLIEEKDFVLAKNSISCKFVGLFHSHKSSYNLSERDMAEIKNSNVMWLIGYILKNDLTLCCYIYNNGKLKELKIY